MLYFDTSFLVPLIVPESESQRVEAVFQTVPVGKLGISHWTRVEFSSAIGIKVRMKELSAAQGFKVVNTFEELAKRSFTVLVPTVADYLAAEGFLREFRLGLRSGDALHLAVARNHASTFLYSLDQRLLKAARHFGIKAGKG